jgi:predicted MPP superfamily phosphohydrolase
MKIDRRRFITLAGLTGVGAIVGGQWLVNSQSSAIAQVSRPKSELLLRFAAIADTGSGTLNQYTVGRALEKYHQQNPFKMVIMAGDNIYTNGEIEKIDSAFNRPYETLRNRGVKFYACLGNHDIRSENGDRQIAYPEFNMQGKRYYTFNQGDVQFFVLETNAISNPRATDRLAQLAWLDRELAKSKARWKIVYGHHNIISAGRYGINEVMLQSVSPILAKHKVKLWINGHDHNYQRTQPIQGTTYLTAGGGGATLYPIVTENEYFAVANSVHSFAAIEVYVDRIFIEGIDSQNRTIDQALVLA